MATETENVRRVRAGYEAWNRGDLEAVIDTVSPDFEFHTRVEVPGIPQVVRGPDELRRFFTEWYVEPWEGNLHMQVDHLIGVGDDRVLGLITFQGRGRGSGAPVEVRYGHVFTIRDGVNVRLDGYPSWRRALDAVGMTEADLAG